MPTTSNFLPEICTDKQKSLRVFDPPAGLSGKSRQALTPRSFFDLDGAFQCLAGWSLQWNGEPRKGADTAWKKGDHAWISIDDLSDRLPPGVPAQSRIYCENLITKLNRLISEITVGSGHGAGDLCNAPQTRKRQQGRLLAPCFQELISLVPLGIQSAGGSPCSSNERTNWYFRPSGVVIASLCDVRGPEHLIPAGRTAAKAAFLSASRQNEDSKGVFDNVASTFDQAFDGELELTQIVWTLDPLLGLGSLCGDQAFQVELDGKALKACNESSRGFVWLRGQKMVAFHAGLPEKSGDLPAWKKCVDRCLGNYAPKDWQLAMKESLSRAIPAIKQMPELALAAIRN